MPSSPELLRTPRLRLRAFTAADDLNLFDLDSDPEVMRYLTNGSSTPLEQIQTEVIPRVLANSDVSRAVGFFAAELLESGAFIGWFHLRPLNNPALVPPLPADPEIGYRLKRSAWNRGYATEGSTALADLAFLRQNAPRVVATTLAANTASRAVMTKLGMTLDREFIEHRFPGPDKQAVLYAITREQWPARRA